MGCHCLLQQRSLAGYNPWGCKESNTNEQLTLSLLNIPLCVCVCIYIYLFIHPSVNRHLCGFPVLGIVNSAAMNIGVHGSFQISVFVVFGYIPRSGIAGSYGRDQVIVLLCICLFLR